MCKIMIVDDAMFMRQAIKTILGNKHDTIEAGNGYDAIELFKKQKPNIITMDITMPVMDGITSVKEIRKIDKDVKIIMISALGQEKLIKEAIINGANTFIVKPFKEEILLDTISNFL